MNQNPQNALSTSSSTDESSEQLADVEKERASYLESILNSLNDGLVVIDKAGTIVLANPVAEQITGQHLTGLNFGQRVANFIEFRHLDGSVMLPHESPTSRILNGETFKDYRFLIKSGPNLERILCCNGSPVYNQDHSNGGVILFRDVSEEEHHQQELISARHTVEETQEALLELNAAIVGITELQPLLERIVQIMPIISGCDRLGITLYNSQTQELIPAAVYGLAAEEVGNWKQAASKRDRSSPYDSHLFEEHKLLEIDYSRLVEEVQDQGNELPNPYNIKNLLIIPLAYQDEMLGIITLDHASKYHTFSPRELQVLEAMAQMAAFAIANVQVVQKVRENAVLREANQLKDEFMSLVAHELRNPLSSVRGYTQLTKRQLLNIDLSNSKTVLSNLDRIIEQSGRMNRLVGDLLELTRIDSGQLDLRLDWCNLVEITQETIATFRLNEALESETEEDGKPKTHEFNLELASGPEESHYTGFYDKDRLGQVISNLVSNAIKYSPKGGLIRLYLNIQSMSEAEASINFSSQTQIESSKFSQQVSGSNKDGGKVIHFSISDQGIGIPKDQLNFLFTRFFRSSNSRTSKLPGLGLGLYISNQIIKLHGGKMWVESPGEDRGTSFHFVLPYKLKPFPEVNGQKM